MFECFDSDLNGSNLHSNASNPFRMVGICIRMLQIHFKFAFECLESLLNGLNFAFECFESLLNDLNSHSKASISFQMVRIWIRVLRISFEGLEFVFERFKTLAIGSNLHS